MRVERVYNQNIVCEWRQDTLKKKIVVASREDYGIQCGGNPEVHRIPCTWCESQF